MSGRRFERMDRVNELLREILADELERLDDDIALFGAVVDDDEGDPHGAATRRDLEVGLRRSEVSRRVVVDDDLTRPGRRHDRGDGALVTAGEHLNLREAADAVGAAVQKAVDEKKLPAEAGGDMGTRELGDFIASNV